MYYSGKRSTTCLPSPFGRGAGGEGNREVAIPSRKALTLTLSQRERGRRCRNRRGQALVEFAIVSLVVYMLLAAILTFGQILYCAQTIQQAADVAAREISRTPLLATANVMDVLYSNNPGDYSSGSSNVRAALFNPQLLEYDLTTLPAGQSILDQVNTWPVVNQMLYPLMISDHPTGGNTSTLVIVPWGCPLHRQQRSESDRLLCGAG